MDRITEHLFVLEGDGTVRDFPGNYTDYRLQKKESPKVESSTKQEKEPATKRPPREKKAKLSYKEQRELEQLTEQLPLLEKQLQEIETTMNSGTATPQELVELAEQYSTTKESLDSAELQWLELSEIEG